MGDDQRARGAARAPTARGRAGRGAGRSANRYSAVISPSARGLGDLGGAAADAGELGVAGTGVGSAPASRRPRPLAPAGPRAARRPRGRPARAARRSEQAAGGRAPIRSPQRITTSSPPSRSSSARARPSSATPRRRRARVASRAGTRPRRRGRSGRRAWRSASSALGRAVAIASLTPRRRTPLRIRRSRIGESSSGSQPSTSTVWANSRSGTVACSAGAASARARSSRDALADARVDVGRVEALAHQPREQEALLVGRLAADQGADVALMARRARRRPRARAPTTPDGGRRRRGPAAG